MKYSIPSLSSRGTLVMLILSLFSCTSIRLISAYDEITDKAVTVFQEKVSRFFVKLDRNIGTDKAAYPQNQSFYDDARVDLNTLQIRTNAIDNNKLVQDQVTSLTQMINDLEKLHRLGFSSREELVPIQNAFNSAFTALTKLQMGLKRGEK